MGKQLLAVFLIFPCSLVFAGEEAKAIQAKMQGDWKMVQALNGGKPAPEDKIASTTATITGNRIVILSPGRTKGEEIEFKLDVGKKPQEMDLQPPGLTEKKLKGIFRLEGDRLTIAFAKEGGDRPTEFSSPEGQRISLLVFERTKK